MARETLGRLTCETIEKRAFSVSTQIVTAAKLCQLVSHLHVIGKPLVIYRQYFQIFERPLLIVEYAIFAMKVERNSSCSVVKAYVNIALGVKYLFTFVLSPYICFCLQVFQELYCSWTQQQQHYIHSFRQLVLFLDQKIIVLQTRITSNEFHVRGLGNSQAVSCLQTDGQKEEGIRIT